MRARDALASNLFAVVPVVQRVRTPHRVSGWKARRTWLFGAYFVVLAVEVVRQDDRFRQFSHGPAQAAALVAQPEIRLFLGESMPRLENSFGALHDFPRLEISLHLEGFRHQPGVLDGNGSLAG